MSENNNSSRMDYIVKNLNYMLLLIAIIVVGFFLCKLVSCGNYVETKERVVNIANLDPKSVDYHVVAEITGSFSADRTVSKTYRKGKMFEWSSNGVYTFSCTPIFQYYVDWDKVVIQENGSMLNIYMKPLRLRLPVSYESVRRSNTRGLTVSQDNLDADCNEYTKPGGELSKELFELGQRVSYRDMALVRGKESVAKIFRDRLIPMFPDSFDRSHYSKINVFFDVPEEGIVPEKSANNTSYKINKP